MASSAKILFIFCALAINFAVKIWRLEIKSLSLQQKNITCGGGTSKGEPPVPFFYGNGISIDTIKVIFPTDFSKKKNLPKLPISKFLGHIVPIPSSWHLAVSVENRLPTTEKVVIYLEFTFIFYTFALIKFQKRAPAF